MRTQLSEQDRYSRPLLRWNMRHWGGAINNDAEEDHDAEAGDEGSTSILHSLRKRICRDRERQIQVKFFVESLFTNYTCQAQDTTDTISTVIEKYLKAPLEEFKCLRCFDDLNNWEKNIFLLKLKHNFFKFQYFRFWKHFEETSKANEKIVKALLKVVRQHLTPPPSSTNVERLFSYGGLVATDHRSTLSGEKLDQILFLRENALMANFNLGWL